MCTAICKLISLHFEETNLRFTIKTPKTSWTFGREYRPYLETALGTLYFSDAEKITHKPYESGLGEGILSHFEGFSINGSDLLLSFETLVWIEKATGFVHFEWIPLVEEALQIKKVCWPGYMEFDTPKNDWYTLLNLEQGLLIPNDWETPLPAQLPFDGRMATAASYMPWFGQIKENQGYIAIVKQPADAGYDAVHPKNGPFTHVGVKLLPSLGRMDYRRTISYAFSDACDYNDLCKLYRSYVMEQGTFRSLKEKGCVAPVEKLVGTAFVHAGIKTYVQPDSRFFDAAAPEKNNHLVPFSKRAAEIRHYHEDLGLSKLYLHLDGWGEPGYDNAHPDYLPACNAAGGYEGMKELVDTIHECGYFFGIHDQYRDYYFTAKTFDKSFATLLADGTYPEHANWAGGHQTYLCGTQVLGYVKRNFSELKEHEISLDCAYLDVFTCNEGDECINPRHKMTRTECLQYRKECFSYLLAHGILTSSEEVTDWAIPALVFCHYAPYDFMLREPESPKYGIPVPLFNLVYHDCLVIPWMMEQYSKEDYMLYALLNGGVPYLHRNGAYQNTDGSFPGAGNPLTEKEMADRCRIVMKLHENIAYSEMVSHKILDDTGFSQQTVFSNGTTVTVDFNNQSYEIKYV